MSTTLPTASALDRAWNCPASQFLPRVRRDSEWSARGTAIHAFIDNARRVGREAALATVADDVRDFCEVIPLDKLPSGGSHEVKMAWCSETGEARLLKGSGHRDYSDARPSEICGTADFLGTVDGRLICPDWKTGFRSLGDPKDSWAMRYYAMAGALITGVDSASIGFVYLREDGSAHFRWAELDAFDLAETADRLRDLVARLDEHRDLVAEGSHCDFCECFNACPAKNALALSLGQGSSMPQWTDRPGALTAEAARNVWLTLERAEDVLERVRNALRERAAHEPIDLGDGRVLGVVDWPVTSVRAEVAWEEAQRMCGGTVADELVPRKATLAALKRQPGLLEAVERAGGVVRLVTKQVRTHRRKK